MKYFLIKVKALTLVVIVHYYYVAILNQIIFIFDL